MGASKSDQGAMIIAVLRTAKAKLESFKEIEHSDARRAAVRAWALGLGYKAFNNDDNQAWQAGVKSKFERRLARCSVTAWPLAGAPLAAGSAAAPELADSRADGQQGQSPATTPAASGIKAARAPHGGGRRRRARRAARRQRDAAAAASWAVQQPLSSQGSLTAVSAFQSNWWWGVGFPLGPVNHGQLLDGSAGL